MKNLSENHEEIVITTRHITLGQFLKLTNVFESGGFIKQYLQNNGVFVNDKLETRRGRKLYKNDVVRIENGGSYIVVDNR